MPDRPTRLPADPSQPSAEWIRHTIDAAGLRISALERRNPSPSHKPAIVLLHGLVAEADTFRRLIRLLPSDRRIVALDMPGAGYSERPSTADVSFTGLAHAVLAAFTALDLHQPILLGHSHGGAVSLALAAENPEAISGLILLAPAHPFSTYENKLIRFYLSRPGHLFAHTLPHIPRWLFLAAFRNMPGTRDGFGYPELAPYLHTIRTPGTVPHLLRLLRSWFNDMARLGAGLHQSQPQTPTLLLWGDRDFIVPASTASQLMQTLPNSTLIVFNRIGHLPNDEDPAETARVINHWLNSAEQAALDPTPHFIPQPSTQTPPPPTL